MKPILHIVVCTTRPGRVGPAVARWAHEAADAHGGFDAKLVDLADFSLPVFDEPEHPRQQNYRHAHTRAWSQCVDAADAFVFVTPEYNHGPPGSLVNAMNFLVREWQYKPAGFVSYGGVSGGMRGVEVTKLLLNTLNVVPILEGVVVPHISQHIGENGTFSPSQMHADSATGMLDELLRWSGALRQLRM